MRQEALRARFQAVRLLLLDIDGVMTDGRVFWNPVGSPEGQASKEGQRGGWTRFFHVRDGYGIKLLLKAGIPVGVLSGGESEDVVQRMKLLGIVDFFLGNEDKLQGLEKLKKKFGVSEDQIAFMGDDLFDLPVLERVGLSCSVPDATEAVRRRVHYVTQARGGYGAVREVIDQIRVAQQLGPYVD